MKTFRLRDEDADRLTALKDLWGSSEVAVIRRLLLEAARREGIEEREKAAAAGPNGWRDRFQQLLAKAQASDTGAETVEEIEREVTLTRFLEALEAEAQES